MKKRILNIIVLIILLIIILLYSLKILEIIKFKCIFKELFGIYCAGCGTTRMIKALLKLDIYNAFIYNPVMFIYFILFGIYFIYNAILYIKEARIKKPKFCIVIILIVILFVYMLLRNIIS